MASHSTSSKLPFGATKFCQDIATLLNNRQGSDIQFKVGGGISTQENGETIYDESATVTLYAHSLILRCRSPYFVTLLDNDKDWKEKSKCIIYKPNISPNTFEKVLCYIYTGDFCAINLDNIIELIMVANEMGLEELSTECQSEFIRTLKYIFSDEGKSTKEHIPVNAVIRTHIIPALNLASNRSLSNLSQELLTIILPHMSVIIKSPDAYTTFINGISSESLVKIIASDDLAITERKVWDLSMDWACRQTKLSKTAIEARLSNFDDDEEDGDGEPSDDKTMISHAQLKQFKKILTPLLPSIRFSLLESDEYTSMVNILTYILPRRRYVKINEYFLHSDGTALLDVPRKNSVIQKTYSRIVEPKIVVEPRASIEPKVVVEPIVEPKIVAEPKIIAQDFFRVALDEVYSLITGHTTPDWFTDVESNVTDPKIVIENTAWELLRKNIFETGGIPGCHSSNDLKFELLFRASEHDFLASIFHECCDKKGPTLLIVMSADGHLCGGVNFSHWKSDRSYSSSTLNFLFALPDERHRKDLEIFRVKETNAEYSSYNSPLYGPTFGGGSSDLFISNSANTNQKSYSNLPYYYYGEGASETALAGSRNFRVYDYDVFAISKW